MPDRIRKLIDILKSWKGEKPDLENLDFSRYRQTEADYQVEQREWLASAKKKKTEKEKQP